MLTNFKNLELDMEISSHTSELLLIDLLPDVLLTYIYNLSLRTSIVPTAWKSATVTPLHKSGSCLLMDSNLNWHDHIDYIASKLSSRLGLLVESGNI